MGHGTTQCLTLYGKQRTIVLFAICPLPNIAWLGRDTGSQLYSNGKGGVREVHGEKMQDNVAPVMF